MKKFIYLSVFALTIVACGSTKDMQNQALNNQVNELQTNVSTLSTDNKSMKDKILGLEKSNAEAKSKLSDCDKELKNISSIYNAYASQIKKMKGALEAAFPNNLKDINFSIIEEDGRLIIRLPNRILYRSGSADLNTDALLVIQKLAKIFDTNQDLNILVEGHTDDVPLQKGSKYQDNWDLSLARAVKVVRQLQTYGIYPQRLTAAGRANYVPLDRIASEEARAKNRRTEIIIRPKIAEVIKAMSELN